MDHDYARIWRRVPPAERDRRISIALERLAAGENLQNVAATWRMHTSSLCRALLAYAPSQWRMALVARAIVRHDVAVSAALDTPGKLASARVYLAEWHLDHSLRVAGLMAPRSKQQIARKGKANPIKGPCPDCASGTTWVSGTSARCLSCGTESSTLDYLSRLAAETTR